MDWYQFFYGPGSINHRLFMLINHADNHILDLVMPKVTFLGNVGIYYFYFAILGAVCLLKPKWLPPRHLAVFVIAYFFSLVVEGGLKQLFHVPRPAAAIGVENFRLLVDVRWHNALPSGHAVLVFLSAYSLSYGRGAAWKVPLYIWAVLMAYSRIYVGAHYPLDVLCGALVGIGCGYVVWRVFERATPAHEKKEE